MKVFIFVVLFLFVGIVPAVLVGAVQNSSRATPEDILQYRIAQIRVLVDELTAKTEELTEQVQALLPKPEPAPAKVIPVFTETLREGQTSEDVKRLQEFLKGFPEIYPEGLVTGYFGSLTKAAVIRFQEKYATEVLVPIGLTQGTGFVGEKTIAKLNQLAGSMSQAEQQETEKEIAGTKSATGLSVKLTAIPSSGKVPLNDVDLKATVSGSSTGDITYQFDCNEADNIYNSKGWDHTASSTEASYTAENLCNYSSEGKYIVTVLTQRGGLTAQATSTVTVSSTNTGGTQGAAGPVACTIPVASGAETYNGSTKTQPKITQIILDPNNVQGNEFQEVTVAINDGNGNPITSVEGTAFTDEGETPFSLELVSGTETNGTWQGTWLLLGTNCSTYQVRIDATSASGSSRITLSMR